MSTSNEAFSAEPAAAGLQPIFGDVLTQVQAEGYPAQVAWQTELAENSAGYIITAGGTLRAVAVIEQVIAAERKWLVQTIRVRRDVEDELLHSVLQEMLEQPDEYEADEESVSEAMYNLYLARGLILQYPSVILECNTPGVSFATDAQSSSPAETEFITDDPVDIAAAVEAALEGDESATAQIAIDVATHMGAFPETFVVDGQTYSAYRTRLSNYPWAYYRDDITLRDLVLIKIGEGRAWAVCEVGLDRPLSAEYTKEHAEYEYQVRSGEIVAEITVGIIDRIQRARGRNVPDYLMIELLAEEAKRSQAEVEQISEVSQYETL